MKAREEAPSKYLIISTYCIEFEITRRRNEMALTRSAAIALIHMRINLVAWRLTMQFHYFLRVDTILMYMFSTFKFENDEDIFELQKTGGNGGGDCGEVYAAEHITVSRILWKINKKM